MSYISKSNEVVNWGHQLNLEVVSFFKVATISFCGIVLFFLGFAFSVEYLGLISWLAILCITVGLSYYSRSWLSGILIGVLAALTFLLGYLTFECVQVSINPIRGPSSYPVRIILERFFYKSGSSVVRDLPETWMFLFLKGILGFDEYGRLPSILSAVSAFASVGAFSGLIGYISKQLSPSEYESKALVFRDYWSQHYGWNKSDKTEYKNLDRKLASWSLSVRKALFRLQNIRRKKLEPETELVFIPDKRGPEDEPFTRGSLYSFHSGRLIGNFVNYRELIGKYKPKLVHSPSNDLKNFLSLLRRKKTISEEEIEKEAEKEASKSLSFKKIKIRKLKIEESVEKLLNKLLKSPFIPLFFLIILIYRCRNSFVKFSHVYSSNWLIIGTVGVGAVFLIVFFMVLNYWLRSQKLLEKRPDEVFLIFIAYSVFLIVALWVIPNIIDNQPEMIYRGFASFRVTSSNWVMIPQSWFGYWLWFWTVYFFSLTVLLGYGYKNMHREAQTINAYFFAKDVDEVKNPEIIPFGRESNEEIDWIKKDSARFYWVIRYMYYWPIEFTLPKSHDDWERIEVWIDAETGYLKWVVSDYHYRELWYKPTTKNSKKLSDLKVLIAGNVHTPVPILEQRELSELSSLNLVSKNNSGRIFSKDSLEKFVEPGLFAKIILTYLRNYPWTYMRYLYGVNYRKEGEFFYKKEKSTFYEDKKKLQTVVIYRSIYGSTKKYAEWVAEELKADLFDVRKVDVEKISEYELIIFGGSLHGASITGVKLIKTSLSRLLDKKIIVFAVGASPPSESTLDEVKNKNFLAEEQKKIRFYYLRGGFNYNKLDWTNKILMTLLKVKLKLKKHKTPYEKGMLDAYSDPKDYTLEENIKKITKYAKSLIERDN